MARSAASSRSLPPRRRPSSGKPQKKAKKAAGGRPTGLLIGGACGLIAVVGVGAFLMSGGATDSSSDRSDGDRPAASVTPESTPASTPTDAIATTASTPEMPAATSTVSETSTAADSTPAVAASVATAPATTSPAATTAPAASVTADNRFPLEPDAARFEWGRLPKLKVPPNGSDVESPASPTPFLAIGFVSGKVVGSESWNLATGKKIGQLQGDAQQAGPRSLSCDGTMLAALDVKRQHVTFWSYETGTPVGTAQIGDGTTPVGEMILTSPTRLVTYTLSRTAGGFSKAVKLFSVPDGKLLNTIEVESPWYLKQLAVSANGRYLAWLDRKEGLSIYETESLERLVRLPMNGASASYANPDGAAFSVDGTRLAAVYTTADETSIKVLQLRDGSISEVNLAGNLVSSALTGDPYVGPVVEWLPDDSGWVLFGRTIVDAATGLRVWTVDSAGLNGTKRRQILLNGMLVHKGGMDMETQKITPQQLVFVDWPRDDIQKSLAALAAGTAVFRPGSTVEVKVETGTLKHGEPEQTQAELKSALEQRMQRDGMQIGAESGIVLHAHYSEQDGQTLHMRDRNVPRSAQVPTGPGIQSTVAVIQLELRLPDKSKPVWTTQVNVDPRSLLIRGEANAQSAREAMFQSAQRQITAAAIPWFIPDDNKLPTLPGLTMYDSR
ncbi:MAG: hypothetical protein R3C59_28615 [Planctomycetaceae bacterium]